MAEVEDAVELSPNSMVGITSLGTIKLKGRFGQQEVVVLINCRATYNFTAQHLVESLKLPLTQTFKYGIK